MALNLAARRAAVNFLFRLPATFVSRLMGVGIHQPAVHKQLPHTAQRSLHISRQRLARDHLSPAQRQQLTFKSQPQRLLLRCRQRRNQEQQPPDQRSGHVS
ncbi:hypothetical protein [Pseudomonas svalbardensis]|uniref:hypothetical protein n=1 Tax=Pseudomonas svalbardensis TaxID=3042029 RepID=UPI00350E424A